MTSRRMGWRQRLAPEALRARFLRVCREVADQLGNCPSKKRRYPNRNQAMSELDRVRRKRQRLQPAGARCERTAYHCRHCNGWHLTSQAKRATARTPS